MQTYKSYTQQRSHFNTFQFVTERVAILLGCAELPLLLSVPLHKARMEARIALESDDSRPAGGSHALARLGSTRAFSKDYDHPPAAMPPKPTGAFWVMILSVDLRSLSRHGALILAGGGRLGADSVLHRWSVLEDTELSCVVCLSLWDVRKFRIVP